METKQLEFTGHSDDTFACTGPRIDVDYDTCASGRPVHMVVASGDDSLLVVGQYAPGPCGGWLIGVAPHDPMHEDRGVPAWPMRYVSNPAVSYSPMLVIDAPADARVYLVDAKGKPLRSEDDE